MKLDKLLNQNPDGLSFKSQGTDYIPVYFKTGYFVALTDNSISKKTRLSTIESIKRLADSLNIKTYFFGYWKDSKTGTEYLDLSLHIKSKKKAFVIAKTFGQKAIFDCQKLDSVYL